MDVAETDAELEPSASAQLGSGSSALQQSMGIMYDVGDCEVLGVNALLVLVGCTVVWEHAYARRASALFHAYPRPAARHT